MDLNLLARYEPAGAKRAAGNSNRRWRMLGALAVVGAGALGGFVWFSSYSGTVATAHMDPDCDLLAGPCSATFPGGERIGFAIAPDGVPLSQPLVLIALTGSLPATSVEVDLQGVDMDYGFNHTVLAPTGEGRFNGIASLPLCATEDIAWRAAVTVHTDKGPYEATFDFVTPAGH